MKVAIGRLICDMAALSESYYHAGLHTAGGYRAVCDVLAVKQLPGVWSAEVEIEEAVRRLRSIDLACHQCRIWLEETRDPVTRLGEVGKPRSRA